MRLSSEELFVHRYNDLLAGVKSARDDYDIVKLGAILRQLLLDGLVHRANRNHRIKLRFFINKPSSVSELPIKPAIIFHAEAINPQSIQTAEGQESVRIDKFLKVVIIEIEGEEFTVKDIIKYAANKAGGVHFDPNLDDRETAMQETLTKLDILGVSPLANAVLSISKVVLQSLVALRQAIVKVPASIPLVAHYKVPRGGAIFFAGDQWLSTEEFNFELEEGFTWAGVLRISEQSSSEDRIIYEAGTLHTGSRLSIVIGKNGSVSCVAQFQDLSPLKVESEDFTESPLFDTYVFLLCELCLQEDKMTLQVRLNNRLVGSHETNFRGERPVLKHQVIGGDLEGKHCATFYAREIILSSQCLDKVQRKELADYMWFEWKD